MKKILNWIKRNKGLFIVLILTIILLIFITVIFIGLLVGGSSDPYGNRLDGIEDVKIAQEIYDGVEEELMSSGQCASAKVRLQGKNIYTTIVLNSDVSVDRAKELAGLTLDNYKEEELAFYDMSFFLKWENEEGDKVIAGNKHHTSDDIYWTKG